MALACALLAGLALPPSPVKACGPFFPLTVFIQKGHPDVPLEAYAAGNLGIVDRRYARSFLVVAYLYLSGRSFDASEQKQLMTLWARRYYREESWLGEKRGEHTGLDVWLDARNRLLGLALPEFLRERGTWKQLGSYQAFQNCLSDAFQTAADTLGERVRVFGRESTAVTSWIRAQDTVFQNCPGHDPVTQKDFIPEADTAGLPALIQADRQYQIAAAHFYAGDWDDARSGFLSAAADPNSPWKDLSRLVAIRCLIRKATLSTEKPVEEARLLSEAGGELEKILADPSLASLHAAAHRLQGFVEFRLHPEQRLRELAKSIAGRTSPQSLLQDLEDYTQLLRSAAGSAPDSDDLEDSTTAQPVPMKKVLRIRVGDPLTEWILTFEAHEPMANAHALSRWQKTQSLPWLVAALAGAHKDSPENDKLLAAAAQVPAQSRGYLTVAFHRARLLAETGRSDEARSVADGVLRLSAGKLPSSARNLFLALRMTLSKDLEEFLRFAARKAPYATMDLDEEGLPEPEESCEWGSPSRRAACEARRSLPPLFDADASMIFTEGMPTPLLAQAAGSSTLPAALRRQVAQAAWVRAVLLEDDRTAQQLVPILSALAPELAGLLKDYDAAASAAARQFAAVFLLLHRPELHPFVYTGVGRQTAPGRIDSYRDNWWCTAPPDPNSYESEWNYYDMYTKIAGPLVEIYPDKKARAPAFVTAQEQQEAAREWQTILKLNTAPSWMAAQVLDWSKAHPEDPRVPEALHLAVRATRYGCTDDHNSKYSKAAFELLHRRYPRSEWAQKTPFWF